MTDGGPQLHATDGAIVETAETAGVSGPSAQGGGVTAHLPFRSGRSFSASATGTELTVKARPRWCCRRAETLSALDGTVAEMAAGGLRVIAVARRTLTTKQAAAVRKTPTTSPSTAETG